MMVLETHSLRTTDASFSESLYGLRRRGVEIGLKKSNVLADSGAEMHQTGLQKHQKLLSVVFLVVLPCMKSKLQSVYDKDRQATLQASLWGDSDERYGDSDYLGRGDDLFGSRVNLGTETSARVRWTERLQKTVGACYPWPHTGTEGLSFAYQLLYLLDATGFYSPGLHALGIHVCRATGQELMDTSSQISKIRSRERERLRGPPWLKGLDEIFGGCFSFFRRAIQCGLLSCIYAVLDYAQTGLIASVFFFKMMEWWYQSAEDRMSAPAVYPPPPPPIPPMVAKDGIPLPTDKTLCPLCSQKRANPSVLTASGFVFCYTCIFKYVTQYKRCPVTLMPATVDLIRRLFHDV